MANPASPPLTVEVPRGVSAFEVALRIVELLSSEHDAEVVDIDLGQDGGSITLSVPVARSA